MIRARGSVCGRRMEREEEASGVAVPQFLSTHPSSRRRVELISEWLPQAEEVGRRSECVGVGAYGEIDSRGWGDLVTCGC